MTNVIYKRCTKCGVEKPATSEFFYKDNNVKCGLSSWCKECIKEGARNRWPIYRSKNKDIINKKNRDWRENNKELYSKKKKEYYKKYRDVLLGKYKQRYHDKGYGKVHSDTLNFINKNNLRPNVCSICGKNDFIYPHHPDYSKWNMIIRCCKRCHGRIHSGLIECPTPIDLLKLI